MADLTRRQLVKCSMAAGAVLAIARAVGAEPVTSRPTMPAPSSRPKQSTPISEAAELRWLEAQPPRLAPGVTWGVPWPRGAVARDARFTLGNAAVQSWPLAYWPDGSIKWSGHATNSLAPTPTLSIDRTSGSDAKPSEIKIEEQSDSIVIDTRVIRAVISKSGTDLIASIERGGRPILERVSLIAERDVRDGASASHEKFVSAIGSVEVEQRGPVRAVVKISGVHSGTSAVASGNASRRWLPFVVRLYFYLDSAAVRVMHSFVFDGDQNTDFISGLGLTASVPMRGALHDRHVRFTGEGEGLWAESVRNLSGLRRDPGAPVVAAQLAGMPCPPTSEFAEAVRTRLDLIPAWGDFSLCQLSPDSFDVKKRTKSEGVTWIHSANGGRAGGVGYVGSPEGGVVFGLRDFWQRYPTQLDIRGANSDNATITAWMYSPDAQPMDLRGYHDGMGMDTHAKQLEGLNITYEDWEPGFSEPYGIARSSELTLWAVDKTPPRADYAEYARALNAPPLLVCEPERYQAVGVFGGLWGLVDRSTPARAKIEDELDFEFEFYLKQRDERRWYGFWDYGDVMHTYDKDRHVWRYDVGGYAWDNSELSPDLWLYYTFLRTGRADVFRFAEAMTRHTGEVDVYHLGKWKGLGSRHNVLHWGCSAKQLRISTAVYRRFYYYLTGDERVGDLMRELVDADKTFLTLDPIRKIREGAYEPKPEALAVGFGTDWGSFAIALLTEWERTLDEKIKTKLLNGVKTIGAMPHGFFSRGATYDLASGAFTPPANRDEVGLSHLSAVFGLNEICAELISTFPEEKAFKDAWMQYCELYNAPQEERKAAFGADFGGNSLTSAHSRLTAFVAKDRGDAKLAERAWSEFVADARWAPDRYTGKTKRVEGPDVLRPIDEAAWISTNDAATWGLAAIENLHLIGDALPADLIPPKGRDR
jgi:hypothetical protein